MNNSKHWIVGIESLLRRLPLIGMGKYPESPTKVLTDWNIRYSDLAQGRAVHVTTWNEIATRHERCLAGSVNYLLMAGLSGTVSLLSFNTLLVGGSPFWGILAAAASALAAYCYRTARSQYNNFTDYEYMPAVTPTIDLEDTMARKSLA
jgi:hypothetical protein